MSTLKLEGDAANQLVRVLTGQRLKYTCTFHLPNGNIIQWESDDRPMQKWNDEARALWVWGTGYESNPIMPWAEGGILLVEKNDKAT